MLFCTSEFLVFFLLVFAVYWAMPWKQWRIWLLVGASYYFYACWNHQLALLVFSTTVVDYFIGLGLERLQSKARRRLLLIASLVMNLGILCYFKYTNFFLDSLKASLDAAGYSVPWGPLEILLPVGISFYTFEAINYTVDVYKRRIPAERNLSHFLLFITFFPHLVAGPIVRARDFLPQVRTRKRFSWTRMQLGVQLFLLGLIKKLAIADRMALYVDPVFKNPSAYSSHAVWLATIAYALQIYCDFSGYTDMALGTAHMLGYKLAQNFNMPYLAVNVSDFWRRWHMSLSTWLRDYLYIPLGGSRGGEYKTVRNLMITMSLGGLWHGASWTFVVWGIYHGILLIVHRLFQKVVKVSVADASGSDGWPSLTLLARMLDRFYQSTPGTAYRIALTFLAVTFGWVFFRAQTFHDAAWMFKRLLIPSGGAPVPMPAVGFWWAVVLVVLAHAAGSARLWKSFSRVPAPVLGFSYAAVLCLVLMFNLDTGAAFIYFQF
jgi:alginate O-acetyltransferase complex protein AlgI